MNITNMTSNLKKLTHRELNFLFNFMTSKQDNKYIDNLNFDYDLRLYDYEHKALLKQLFNMLYDLKNNELVNLFNFLGV